MSSSRRNVPIKADHTLAGSAGRGTVGDRSTTARTLGSRPSTPTLELKRTSPGPRATPSPTPSEKRSSPSLRVKTPSPTPSSLPRRESPSNSQRLSPTLVKARRATPPEEGSPQRATASCGTQVDPEVLTRKTHPKSPDPESAALAPRLRQLSLRSKSQASNHDQAAISQRIAGLRRPRGASPSSISAAESTERAGLRLPDTRDSATQTLGKLPRTSPQQDELSTTQQLEGAAGELPRRSEFLFGPIQLQSELGMAIQAALEFTAERRVTHSYSPSEFAAIGRMHMHLGGEDGSDDETLENLEVRSLSLSEDGPMIARSFSERQRMTAAPDPIAMLSNGQQHAGMTDHEPKHKEGKDHKEHNGSSDLSAAGTENANAPGGGSGGPGFDAHSNLTAETESQEQSLCRNLLPILLPIFEKTAELSASDPAGDSAAGSNTTYQQRFSTRSGPPPTKVRVRSSRARGGRTLDLAELQTAGRRGDAALANLAEATNASGFVAVRSEFSLGSEHSAFTSVSSPSSQSGSKDSTPRGSNLGRSGLRGVASMPTLQQHRGGARSVG